LNILGWTGLREGKHFFFEKKKQKTFGSSLMPTVSAQAGPKRLYNSKSFLVLFFKKELLPYLLPIALRYPVPINACMLVIKA